MKRLLAAMAMMGMLVGCGDNASFFSDVRDEKTKIVMILRQDNNEYPYLVDTDGDGVPETPATQGEIELLQDQGLQLKIVGG